MKIKVLGSGCMSCKKLHNNVLEATKDMKDVEVEYITDISKIISMGIMRTPALVINDKIVSTGRVLNTKEIEELINKN